MATNEVDIIGIDHTSRTDSNCNKQTIPVVDTVQYNYVDNTGVKLFPSIPNNFKIRTDTGNTSNESYTSSDSLLTQYVKVQNKLKWKFLPEQQDGCLLVVTKQILDEILAEEQETWTKFQSAGSQNTAPTRTAQSDLNQNSVLCLSHSKNLVPLHTYFLRFTKGHTCVKICIASPPPRATKGFTYPSSLLIPIEQPEVPAASRFANTDGTRIPCETGNRQLGQLCEDEKRALELAYLCAEFPVLSAPPPPELEQEEDDNIHLQFQSALNVTNTDSEIFKSMDNSSFCSQSNTLSPLSDQTADVIVREKPFPPLHEVSSGTETNGRDRSSYITESQHIETVEMLLAHLRQAFGLIPGDFNIVGKSVRSKAGLFVKGYTGKSETLYRELLHRYQVLEKCQHPYYRQNAFPSKAAYDYWLREEKARINILVDRFYHKRDVETRIKPVIRVPLPRDLHKCYSILLSTLLQYELSYCLTGYLTQCDNTDSEIDTSFDSIQQLRHKYSDKDTFHPSTTRLLEEYALRYGISDTYRHLAFLDCLSREFCIHNIQDCRIIESIIDKLISKLYQLSDIITAHPRQTRPQCLTTTLLKQERNIFLQTLHQLSKKIQVLVTVGIEKIVSANCVNNNYKAIKRVLNRSIILLELVMDTHCTLQNSNTQTKPRNNMLSVESMLRRWFKSFVAESYGYQKLRIAKDHMTDSVEGDDVTNNTLSPVMVNKLLSVVSLEIRRMREYYQEPLRNYLNVSLLVTSEYYKFICQDIEYLCRRHCRHVEPVKKKGTEERDLNMMGLMFNLDHNDSLLWTSNLPEQSITWRNEFLRLFVEKWNIGIQNEMSNFIKSIIKSDKWEIRVIEPANKGNKVPIISPLKPEFVQSPNSAFSMLPPTNANHIRFPSSGDSDNGPIIPQSVHGEQRIAFSPHPSITEDEAGWRDRYISPSPNDIGSEIDYDINASELQSHNKPTSSPASHQSKYDLLNLTIFSKRESNTDQDGDDQNDSAPYNPLNNAPNTSSLAQNFNQIVNAKMKIPVSNSIIDLLVIIARYTSLIVNILQTLSPLKFIRNRSHTTHTGLPLEVLEVKKFIDHTKMINAQMRQALYTEASNTLSKICLIFAYNFLCMDYCGLSREEALEIMSGDKDKLLDQLQELTRDRLTYGCRHMVKSGDYSNLCASGNRQGSERRIEKISKDMALRINNLYVIATMWEGLNSKLWDRMSTQNLIPPSAYFWSTSTTDLQTPLAHNRLSSGGKDGLFSLSNESESKIELDPAKLTQKKLEEALKLEVNVLAYKINSGFLQFFSVLIELNLPDFNEKQRLAPALNYLGDCLHYLGRYLYPDVFRYLLQRIWYNIIKGLESKAKEILKRISSPQRARVITELYLHVLSCLINFFKSSPGLGGLDSHLLMDTSEFFSYLLHFHLLESSALLKVFNLLNGESHAGYHMEFNTPNTDNEVSTIEPENTPIAHTGLSRAEIISYLDVKLSSFRKSFTGDELLSALMALRADTLPREWKGAQYGWEPIAKEISKDLIHKGDITQLNCSQGRDREEGFGLSNYYRIVHSRRIVRSICSSTQETNANLATSLSNESEVEHEIAKINTLQYIYDILRMRENETKVRGFLRAISEELILVLSRDRSKELDMLLVVHD